MNEHVEIARIQSSVFCVLLRNFVSTLLDSVSKKSPSYKLNKTYDIHQNHYYVYQRQRVP